MRGHHAAHRQSAALASAVSLRHLMSKRQRLFGPRSTSTRGGLLAASRRTPLLASSGAMLAFIRPTTPSHCAQCVEPTHSATIVLGLSTDPDTSASPIAPILSP